MAYSLKETKCPVCKRKFIPAPEHIYKECRGKRLVCTYRCMLESERKYEAKKAKKQEADNEQREAD